MTKYLKTEPAAIAGLIQTGTALFLAFKPLVTAGQVAAIWAFSAALTAIIVRQMVQPLAKLPADAKVQNDGNDSGPVA